MLFEMHTHNWQTSFSFKVFLVAVAEAWLELAVDRNKTRSLENHKVSKINTRYKTHNLLMC